MYLHVSMCVCVWVCLAFVVCARVCVRTRVCMCLSLQETGHKDPAPALFPCYPPGALHSGSLSSTLEWSEFSVFSLTMGNYYILWIIQFHSS